MTTPEPTWTVEQACAELARWNAAQERTRASYYNHVAALDDLAVEYPCVYCRQDEHEACMSRSGPARRNRCLCWEMWHPIRDQPEETA